MSTARVFLDTGIFIAFLNQRDRWHAQAVELFSGRKPAWMTSMLVISEGYSWFLHRQGEEAARTFRRLVHNLEGLKAYDAKATDDETVGQVLDRYRGSKLTYADAFSLALLERHRIKQVWSTDHHLGISGAEVLPRS